MQFDGSGSGSGFGKIPGRDAMKHLETGRWYHVACTYDQNTRTARIYVDGQIQSEVTGVGITTQNDKNCINLAMRALYDLWNTAPEGDKAQYEELGYDGLSEAYQFFIGRSYDDYRPLNGKIAEARVWSVARTPEQIWENMYEIENPENDPTLLGYWKCNDASGNTVKDYSMYGNDGVAKYDIIWPQGIEDDFRLANRGGDASLHGGTRGPYGLRGRSRDAGKREVARQRFHRRGSCDVVQQQFRGK